MITLSGTRDDQQTEPEVQLINEERVIIIDSGIRRSSDYVKFNAKTGEAKIKSQPKSV